MSSGREKREKGIVQFPWAADDRKNRVDIGLIPFSPRVANLQPTVAANRRRSSAVDGRRPHHRFIGHNPHERPSRWWLAGTGGPDRGRRGGARRDAIDD